MVNARALVYASSGSPDKVLQVANFSLPSPSSGQALIRFVLSPVNPADELTVKGVYPAQVPTHDGILSEPVKFGGNEGYAVVEALGSGTAEDGDVRVGSRVIMGKLQLGTWRSHAVVDVKDLIPIPETGNGKAISDESAATLGVNPGTAYRMLKDFIDVEKERVTVIQNGGNSVVGLMVIQLCKAWGAKTINLVRSRDADGFAKLKSRLQSFGADHVYTYDDISDENKLQEIKRELGGDDKLPRVAINCVGGAQASDMFKLLGQNSFHITYGSIAAQEFTVPTGPLLFKNITITGFWWSRWTQQHSRADRVEVTRSLVSLIDAGKLQPPEVHVALVKKDDSDEEATRKLREVLAGRQGGKTDNKVVIKFE